MEKHVVVSMLALCCLGGCSERIAETRPYKNPRDRLVVLLGNFPHGPCEQRARTPYGGVIGFVGEEQCYRFDPSTRMRGVWLVEEEASEFLPGATKAPAEWRYSRDAIWLDFVKPEPALHRWNNRAAFEIEFIGQQATYPGRYGQMGGSRRLVIVQSLLSAKPIVPPEA